MNLFARFLMNQPLFICCKKILGFQRQLCAIDQLTDLFPVVFTFDDKNLFRYGFLFSFRKVFNLNRQKKTSGIQHHYGV